MYFFDFQAFFIHLVGSNVVSYLNFDSRDSDCRITFFAYSTNFQVRNFELKIQQNHFKYEFCFQLC